MKKTMMMLGVPGLMLGAAFVAPTAGMAQYPSDEIVVEGRYHRGQLPDDVQSASQPVSYADLDLSTQWGRDELKHRVRLASRYLCNRLGESDSSSSVAPTCRDAAYKDAMDRLGTIEQHAAPRGTAWVRPAPWTTPWTSDWAARYPDDGR